MLGNEPRLGAPLVIVVGHPIYNSWQCPSYVSQRRNADSWHWRFESCSLLAIFVNKQIDVNLKHSRTVAAEILTVAKLSAMPPMAAAQEGWIRLE